MGVIIFGKSPCVYTGKSVLVPKRYCNNKEKQRTRITLNSLTYVSNTRAALTILGNHNFQVSVGPH